MRHVLNRVIVAIVVVCGAPALAAAQTDKGSIGIGYVALANPDRHFPGGWVFAATRNLDRRFALVGEASGGYATESISGGDVNLHTHSVLAGLRLQGLVTPRVSAFAQALIGGTFFGASGADNWSDQAFTVQPGAGMDVRITPKAGVRIQGDVRSHLAGGGEGFGELRVSVGAVFGFGR